MLPRAAARVLQPVTGVTGCPYTFCPIVMYYRYHRLPESCQELRPRNIGRQDHGRSVDVLWPHCFDVLWETLRFCLQSTHAVNNVGHLVDCVLRGQFLCRERRDMMTSAVWRK